MILRELHLPRFRRAARYGTPDLMPYSHLVADGVPILKDGGLLRCFSMYGPDLKSASADQLLAVKHHGNAAFTRLGDGWMVQTDLVRYHASDYMSAGPLPDPVSQLIENQRERHYKAQGTHLETALSMSLTYRPPSERENRARRLFFTDPSPDDERNLEYFLESTNALAHDLRGAHLLLEPKNSDDALSFIESCIIGEPVQVRAPKLPNYLDTFVGRHRLVVSRRPSIGGRALRVVIPTGLPLESHAEVVDFLCDLPFPYRYSVRAIVLGTQKAGRVVSEIRKKHHQKTRRKWDFLVETTGKESTPTYLNEHAVNMAHDATAAAAEAESNVVREVYLSFGVVITDRDARQAHEKAEYVRALFSHHRFHARIEDFNTVEAWRSFIPGDGFSNRRKPVVSTMNLADFTPMRTTWTGDLYNPNPMYPPKTPPLFCATTDGLTPFRFHLHVSDVGHGLALGPIGAGKSTLASYIIAQSFKIPNMQVFAFEKGLSAYILTKACGGEHWDLGNDVIHAAPLINMDQLVEREWAHGYVCTLLKLSLGRNLEPLEDEAVWRALELLAGRPRHFRTITNLQGMVQDPVLKSGLACYTLKGPMGRYIDANEDELLTARFTTFELETLQHNEALVPVLLYLFHRIEQRLDGRPTLVVIDEAAWIVLTEGVFGEKLDAWLRDWRKKNAAVWLLSQSLDDVSRSKYLSVILQGCQSKIFLHDPDAQSPNMAQIYHNFDLTDRHIEIIAQELIAKRTYLLISPKGIRSFDLALDPVTLSFVGASSKEDIFRARQLIEQHGAAWPAHWLRERGLSEAADEFERLAGQAEAPIPTIIGAAYRNGNPPEARI
jgi:type IV secretion/conjugal transfer VirB4 family ATPase